MSGSDPRCSHFGPHPPRAVPANLAGSDGEGLTRGVGILWENIVVDFFFRVQKLHEIFLMVARIFTIFSPAKFFSAKYYPVNPPGILESPSLIPWERFYL
jgi:hypothetical protein